MFSIHDLLFYFSLLYALGETFFILLDYVTQDGIFQIGDAKKKKKKKKKA